MLSFMLFRSVQQTLHYLCDASSGEGHDHSHYVDGELELQEFGDAVVDVATPHDRPDDAGEVVVGENDVRSLFSYVCACDALRTPTKTQ